MGMMVCQTKGIFRFSIRLVKKFQIETLTSAAVVASQALQHSLPASQSLNLWYNAKCLVAGHHHLEHCEHMLSFEIKILQVSYLLCTLHICSRWTLGPLELILYFLAYFMMLSVPPTTENYFNHLSSKGKYKLSYKRHICWVLYHFITGKWYSLICCISYTPGQYMFKIFCVEQRMFIYNTSTIFTSCKKHRQKFHKKYPASTMS